MTSAGRWLPVVLARVCAILAAGVVAAPAAAQGIQIRVVDSATAAPLGGALVALLDAGGTAAAEALTSENGFRTFFAPEGRYRIRVRRIGFRPYVSAAVDLSEARAVTLAVQSEPVVLSTIVISSRTSCRSLDSADTEALGTVWNEATKALQASRLTVANLRGVGRAWTYSSRLSAAGAPLHADTVFFTVTSARPFAALNPESLARGGYVLGDAVSGWQYFGPDETVLLSPSFARTHCFRLVRDRDNPGLVGVAFEPARDRTTPDIEGVAWLDERTSELRRIVFRFVNAGLFSRYGGGGSTNFVRLPSGAWIISSWHLKGPILVTRGALIQSDGFLWTGGGVLKPR